ncbi:536_t:CDS:1, partial [Scutellospora calospora]
PKMFNTLSLKTTKLYSALTHINKAIRLILITSTTSIFTINHHLSIVSKASEISINSVTIKDISINKQYTLN